MEKKPLLVAMLGYLGYHCWPIIFIFGVAPSTRHSNFSGRVCLLSSAFDIES